MQYSSGDLTDYGDLLRSAISTEDVLTNRFDNLLLNAISSSNEDQIEFWHALQNWIRSPDSFQNIWMILARRLSKYDDYSIGLAVRGISPTLADFDSLQPAFSGSSDDNTGLRLVRFFELLLDPETHWVIRDLYHYEGDRLIKHWDKSADYRMKSVEYGFGWTTELAK